jgi:hypothetical protein
LYHEQVKELYPNALRAFQYQANRSKLVRIFQVERWIAYVFNVLTHQSALILGMEG